MKTLAYSMIIIFLCFGCATQLQESEETARAEVEEEIENVSISTPYQFALKPEQETIPDNEKIIEVRFDNGQVLEMTLQEGYVYLAQKVLQLASVVAQYNNGVDKLLELDAAELGLEIKIPEKVDLRWIYDHDLSYEK